MNITTILFDLDGTLLPMDQEAFTTGYFKFLAKKLAPYGYEPKSLVDAIWAGTAAMVKKRRQLHERAGLLEEVRGDLRRGKVPKRPGPFRGFLRQ